MDTAAWRRSYGRATSGSLTAGDELPTVAELAVTHGVSVGTAQRAVALLRTEGLIEVTRGRRATVTAPTT